MDLEKFKIWNSGLTDEEREVMAQQESAKEVFKQEKEQVMNTVNTKGFKVIMEIMVADTEALKVKLQTCSEKELARLQLEIKTRMDFIHSWDQYFM
jgi:hypothetical protein